MKATKLKKGRKKKKEDRTKSTKNRMFALKGLINNKEKQPWFFANQKVRRKPPKEEDQEQVKDLEGNGFKGRARTRKLAQIASRYFTASGTFM